VPNFFWIAAAITVLATAPILLLIARDAWRAHTGRVKLIQFRTADERQPVPQAADPQ
jgi:hypothetical protein